MDNTKMLKIADAADTIMIDCAKAQVLMDEVFAFFPGDGLVAPSETNIEDIRHDFKRIGLKLGMLWDLLDGVQTATREIDETSQVELSKMQEGR